MTFNISALLKVFVKFSILSEYSNKDLNYFECSLLTNY